MTKEFNIVDHIIAELAGDAPVQGFNGRGGSLVTSAPPTGRTTGASGGFDMVDGIPVPEDRSVRRFDGAEFGDSLGNSPFVTSIGGYGGGVDVSEYDDLGNVYDAISNLYGGDASTSSVNQAVAGSLPTTTLNAADASQDEIDALVELLNSKKTTVGDVGATYGIDPALVQAQLDSINATSSTPDSYSKNSTTLNDAAARAAAAIAAGSPNVGGFEGYTNAWDMVPEAGTAGSAIDRVNKQGIIDAYLAELDLLTDNLMGIDTSVIDANAATGIAQSQQNAWEVIPAGAVNPTTNTSSNLPTNTVNNSIKVNGQWVTPNQVQSLVDIIKAAGGNVVEGVADLGNLIFQAVTLGKGPQLEAVIPNLMDIINGGIGGTLVLGGGSNPVTVLGTGQTGVGAGTKVAVDGILGKIVEMVKEGGSSLLEVLKNIPSNVYGNLPEILSAAVSAGLFLDEKDKETLVGLGIEPSILGGTDSDSPVIKTSGTDPDSPVIKTSGTDPDSPVIKTGGTDPDSPVIKTGGTDSDSPVIRTGGTDSDSPVIRTGGTDSDSPVIRTGGTAIETGGGGGGGDGSEATTPEQIIGQGGVRTISTEKAGVADITALYNPTLSLAENMALLRGNTIEEEGLVDSAIYYGGGMIQNTDMADEINRLLRGY